MHRTFPTAGGAIAGVDILKQVLAMVAVEAGSLSFAPELAGCRTIVRDGASTEARRALYAADESRNGSAAGITAVAR